jgi:hypothetical protein
MVKLTENHKEFLIKSGKWIKAHGQKYCPTTAVKHIPKWKKVFKDLEKWKLVRPYKSGDVIEITSYGWSLIYSISPELLGRYKK